MPLATLHTAQISAIEETHLTRLPKPRSFVESAHEKSVDEAAFGSLSVVSAKYHEIQSVGQGW